MYAAPANSNTQLLWYARPGQDRAAHVAPADRRGDQAARRHDRDPGRRVRGPDGVVQLAHRVGRRHDLVGNRGRRSSAPGRVAAEVMYDLANSPAADPSLSSAKEDQGAAGVRAGQGAVPGQLPVHLSVGARPTIRRSSRTSAGRRTRPSWPASRPRAPIGGINWGVGSYAQAPRRGRSGAAACLRNQANQREAALKGGLPPTLASALRQPGLPQAVPVRPADPRRSSTPARCARRRRPTPTSRWPIAKSVSPPTDIELDGFVQRLRQKLKDALNSKGLL